MKKYIVTFFMGLSVALAADQDFVGGVDFTGRTNVTQAGLNALVNNATVATNKGMVIWTNNSPSVAANPKLVRYIWMDTSQNPPVLKTYNTNSGAWAAASVGTGSIGTAQLADSAVSTVKIANQAVDNSKLADDSVTSAKIVDGTIAAGDLGANSVTRAKLYPAVIDGTLLTNNAVSGTNIASGSISNSHLALGFQVFNTNIAANSIANSNLQANVIQGTNIASGVISNSHIANTELSYAKFNTNATLMIPRYWLVIDSAGSITAQATAPGLTACTAARNAQGIFTITFGTAMSSTNYIASVTPIRNTGTATVMVRTNTTALVAYHIQSVAPADIDAPAMVVIHGY